MLVSQPGVEDEGLGGEGMGGDPALLTGTCVWGVGVSELHFWSPL